jgi:hypothetical protein
MSATFSLRKAWRGWSASGGINVPFVSTAIADNELYFYNIDTSNSVSPTDSPLLRPTDSTYNKSYENWIYLNMTKAPSGYCNNFKFWGPSENPVASAFVYCTAYSFALFHTPIQASSRCNTVGTLHYSPGTAINVPGRCSQIGSCTGYFVMQVRISSASYIGQVSGEGAVYHYGFDEV